MPFGGNENKGSATEKAFSILSTLSGASEPMSMIDLGNSVGLPKPSAHRVLAQLEKSGLVLRSPATKLYTIGPELVTFAIKVLSARVRLPDVKSIMQSLVDDIHETVNLAVLDGAEVVYLERVECKERLRINLHAGSRIPVHASSTGKLLAAHLPKQRQKRLIENLHLKEYTEFTITDRSKLAEELAKIKKQGYSTNYQENLKGLIGVGVPVRGPNGDVIAALALHAPEARMSLEQGIACVPRLNAAADQIGQIFTEGSDGHCQRKIT